MRWLWTIAVLLLLGAVAWWWRAAPEEIANAARDVDGPAPVLSDAVDAAVSPAGVAIAQPPAAGPEPRDAGASEVEMLVEVFGAHGHEAARELRFSTRYDGGRGSYGWLTTDVMGFGRISLPPETYEIEPETDPSVVTVTPGLQKLTLRVVPVPEPALISGTVTDERGRPLERAEVHIVEPSPRRGPSTFVTLTKPGGVFAHEVRSAAVRVQATLDGKSSGWRLVPAGTTDLRLSIRLVTGGVRFYVRKGPQHGVHLQLQEPYDVRDVPLLPRQVTPVAVGHTVVRARALVDGVLWTGRTEVDVREGEITQAAIPMERSRGLQLRVVDRSSTPIAGATVHLTHLAFGDAPRLDFAALADRAGELEVVPQRLESYDPLYQIEVQGIWRTEKQTLARLGDAPVTVRVRPFDPAVDSTDAGPQLPSVP